MVICRTPFRISFFGGGTDYPGWYLKHGGSVLSTSINKYCYISLRYLPPFFEHRIRLVYSKIELCQSYEEIQHPAAREILRFIQFKNGLEIHHDGDLPARSGMGSSSSFTVGLLHACYALKGVMVTKKRLALESIHIEQNMIQETVGSQDQIAAAYGGLNQVIFNTNGEIDLHPVILSKSRQEELNAHLMLFYTGIKRNAPDIACSYVKDICKKDELLKNMHAMVEEGLNILQNGKDIEEFGQLLHRAWGLKCNLSDCVTNDRINDYYQRALRNGAIGGKITGAGGGGFLLLFVPFDAQQRVRQALCELLYIPFRFDFSGSQIIIYEPHLNEYSLPVEETRFPSAPDGSSGPPLAVTPTAPLTGTNVIDG